VEVSSSTESLTLKYLLYHALRGTGTQCRFYNDEHTWMEEISYSSYSID